MRETRVPQDAETATHASYTCIIAPTSTGRFTTTRLINPPCLRRRTRTQHTPESNTTDSHHAPERTTTPTGFIFLSSAPYAHRSLPNTGLMSSFAHRQPPGVSTRFERFELVRYIKFFYGTFVWAAEFGPPHEEGWGHLKLSDMPLALEENFPRPFVYRGSPR